MWRPKKRALSRQVRAHNASAVDGARAAEKPRCVSTLIVNAGLAGAAGNSQIVAERCAKLLTSWSVPHRLLVLRDEPHDAVHRALEHAERLIFISGTYWGGCSSLLQRLLEELTSTEASQLWLGKPAAVFVSAHQVGAQSVLWRLQGLLVTLGCLIPPLSGVVITRLGEELRRRAPELCQDVWGLEDVETALANLCATPSLRGHFRAWPVDREHFGERWLENGEKTRS
jgi:NADPH-dependent FMN reductase